MCSTGWPITPSTPSTFLIDYDEEFPNNRVKYFIVNKKSDMPTPCVLQPDNTQGGKWRIESCSL